MLKSALTAALGGDAPAKTSARPSVATSGLLSNVAFPCLRHADADDGATAPTVEASTGFDTVDITTANLTGTGATNVPSSMVDYELNPTKRRGGEEVLGSSFLGVPGAVGSMPTGPSSLMNGSIYGSMPAGMTQEQRMSVANTVPPSPSMNLLNSLGPGKVDSRTGDAKTLRRHVLRGAVVVFVTAGYSGKRFIFERCKELGIRSVILDASDSWSQQLVGEGVVEKFIGLDFSDSDALFGKLVDACKKVRAELGDLDGITTFCELAVPLAARLAEQLGLPGNTPDAVDTARDKHAARQCMEKAGLPTPLHYLIADTADLDSAAKHVGFPAVIKPISGAASIGVVRVNDVEQLQKCYARVVKDLKGAKVVAGALVEGDGEEGNEQGNAGSWLNLSVMMEEYLDGPEVDVDLVLSGGAAVYGCITDNWPTVEPYFNETGSNCPSILPRSQQIDLLDLGIKAVQSMGFEMGVFHVELKFTSRGPRLIEVNARMGGGPVRNTNLLVWGVDLVEEHITGCCGIPCHPCVSQDPLHELAEYSINAKKTGRIESSDFMDKYKSVEGVLYARPLVTVGQKCISVDDGMPTWLAEIMVSMRPVQTAIKWIQDMEEEVTAGLTYAPL